MARHAAKNQRAFCPYRKRRKSLASHRPSKQTSNLQKNQGRALRPYKITFSEPKCPRSRLQADRGRHTATRTPSNGAKNQVSHKRKPRGHSYCQPRRALVLSAPAGTRVLSPGGHSYCKAPAGTRDLSPGGHSSEEGIVLLSEAVTRAGASQVCVVPAALTPRGSRLRRGRKRRRRTPWPPRPRRGGGPRRRFAASSSQKRLRRGRVRRRAVRCCSVALLLCCALLLCAAALCLLSCCAAALLPCRPCCGLAVLLPLLCRFAALLSCRPAALPLRCCAAALLRCAVLPAAVPWLPRCCPCALCCPAVLRPAVRERERKSEPALPAQPALPAERTRDCRTRGRKRGREEGERQQAASSK